MKSRLSELKVFAGAALAFAAFVAPLGYFTADAIRQPVEIAFRGEHWHAAAGRSRLDSETGSTLTLPPEDLSAAPPLLSANGQRGLIRLQSGALMLWSAAGELRVISPPGAAVTEAAIAGQGTRAVFLADDNPDGDSAESSLYLWEDGFGAEQLIPGRFTGAWKVALSGDGRSVVLVPAALGAAFHGAVAENAPSLSRGLLLRFHPRDPSTEPQRAVPRVSLTPLSLPPIESISVQGELVTAIERKADKELLIHKVRVVNRITDADLNGDGASDLLFFRSDDEAPFWHGYTLDGVEGMVPQATSHSGAHATWRVGDPRGIPVPGDYNGDGVLDLATFTPGYVPREGGSSGNWRIFYSESTALDQLRLPVAPASRATFYWGFAEMRAVPEDYDGDGATDLAVFAPHTARWHILYSASGRNRARAALGFNDAADAVQWGLPGDIPLPADYNGDGCADLAVVRSKGRGRKSPPLEWHIREQPCGREEASAPRMIAFGAGGGVPMAADFDGDGAADLIVYDARQKQWSVRTAAGKESVIRWHVPGGVPFLADFDGDKKADPAFYTAGTEFAVEIYHSRAEGLRRIFGARPPAITRLRWADAKEVPVQILLRQHQQPKDT